MHQTMRKGPRRDNGGAPVPHDDAVTSGAADEGNRRERVASLDDARLRRSMRRALLHLHAAGYCCCWTVPGARCPTDQRATS